jgi:hypothetical protein
VVEPFRSLAPLAAEIDFSNKRSYKPRTCSRTLIESAKNVRPMAKGIERAIGEVLPVYLPISAVFPANNLDIVEDAVKLLTECGL